MAASGETALSPQLAASMLNEVRKWDKAAAEEERLVTKREEEVLQLIADGCSTPEVAERLFISQKTVKNHLASIYEQHGARLLERNVRAFLSARGGINRGIRDTLRNQPDRFLAYNNGLTATAASAGGCEWGKFAEKSKVMPN